MSRHRQFLSTATPEMNSFRTPFPHLTCKRSLNYLNPPAITFPLFTGKFRPPSVFDTSARATNNYSPSELAQRGRGRSPGEHWSNRALHVKKDGEALVLSHEELYRIAKLLGSIMSFASVEGDPNKGVEECYRYLARLLKEWHTDIREQEQHSREFKLSRFSQLFSLIRKIFGYIGNIFSRSYWPRFYFLSLLCAIGVVVCIFVLPGFLIWNCCVRKPDPPTSPPPIDPTVVINLLPFMRGFIPSFDPSVVEKLLPPLSSFRLAALAIQLKIFIQVIMAGLAADM